MSGVNLGLNPAYSCIDAANVFCARQDALILQHNAENDENIRRLDLLNKLLAAIKADQQGRGDDASIDYTGSAEKQALIDEVREFAPHVMSPGRFTFKGDEIRRLEESLVNEEKAVMNRFNPTYMQMKQVFEDKDRVIDIIRAIVKEYSDSIRSMNRIPRS